MAKSTKNESWGDYISRRASDKKTSNKSQTSSANTDSWSGYIEKRGFERNFITLQSDLESLYTTIGNAYNGWQTKETMSNTLSSMKSMQDRLGKYQEYTQKYGVGTDLSELHNNLKSILDGWEGLSSEYGLYKDADAYNNEKAKLKELYSMNSSDIQARMNDSTKEAEDLESKLKTAQAYDKKVKDILNGAKNIRNPSAVPEFTSKLKNAENERDNFLKSIGFETVDDLKKSLDGKRVAHTTASGENITWQSLYDNKKYKEDSEVLYSEISSMDDFDEYKNKGANVENPTYDEAEGGANIFGWRPFSKDVENKVEYAISNKDSILASDMFSGGGNKSVGDVVYTMISDKERDIYNYHLGREQAGLAEKGTADEYLNSIYGVLKNRYENKVIGALTEYADEHPVLASGLSVGQNLFSGGEYIRDSINFLRTGELDTNHLAEASSAIRGTVSQKVDWEIGNWDAFDFVYNSGMSMADSVAVMATFGGAGGVALGFSAAAQGTNDALERGLDNKSAFLSGLSAGVFEGVFESVSIGKFKSLKEAPVDGVKSIIKNVGKSMLTNASEETLTEIANLTYDYIANGDLSNAKTQIRAYMSAGMSEKEATRKVALEQAAQVAEAGASGALMGLGFGAVGGTSAYINSSLVGRDIKSKERVSEVFDIASNPEVASAYEAYTQYAKKGIDVENIKDAQLGNLYKSAKNDAVDMLKSKKSTAEQKTNAAKTLAKLSVVETENTVAKRVKELNVGEETKATESGDSVKIKGVKTRDDGIVVVTDNGEVSVDDVTLTQRDAELVAFGEQISRSEGEETANLFVSQYDGNTDVYEYANAFNLTTAYAKNDYTFDTILKNKGVLSTDQVKAIYAETRIKVDSEKQNTIDNLNQKMANNITYNGIIDDSVIDYENTSAKGKVNWNKLDSRQRSAITFIKGFAKATGMNLRLITNGLELGINGSYEVRGNTITLDIYAGIDNVTNLKDTIIPTMSHETTHWMEEKSPELWRKMNELIFSTLQEADGISEEVRIAVEIERLKKVHKGKKGKNITEKEARSEIVARACEDMLSMSEQGKKMFNSLSESEQKTFVEKIKELIQNLKDWVSELLPMYKSGSYEAKLMRKYEDKLNELSKLWDEMLVKSVEANQSLEKSGAFVHKASVDGDVVLEQARELQRKDPRKLTEEDFINLLGFAENKLFGDDTYIPARINTPQILIAFAKEQGYVLEDHPLAMSVYKVRQALSNETEWDGRPSDKPHDLTTEEVVDIVKSMNNPTHLVYQTKNDRFAEIVKFEKDGGKRKAYAIIDFFDVDKNPDIMNGYKGGKYNILVTIYPSENSSELKQYLKNKNNIVMSGEEIKKKGISQGSYGSYVPSLLNDSPFYIDSITNPGKKVKENLSDSNPTKDKDVRFADRNDGYVKAQEMQIEINQLTEKMRVLEKSDEFGSVMDILKKSIEENDAEKGIAEYEKWLKDSGYNKVKERIDTLQNELDKLKKDLQTQYEQKAINEERKAIEKSGLSEADYFRKQAVKEFGYTPYFYDAGYITPNGKMLNFSGEKGMHYGTRGQDHRGISVVYANVSGSKAMLKFMSEGNIRIMAESPGIDISSTVEPSKEQYATIRKFVREYADKEYFNIDITDAEGHTVGNYEYEGKISAERVVNDIKYFFENGTTREQSSISQFLYSDRDSEYMNAVESGDVETASRLIEEAAEKAFSNSKVRGSDGKLRLVYHGTVNDFTVFDRQFSNVEGDFGKGYYFTSNEYDVDANYANEDGPDLKNKIARYAEKLEWEDEYSDLSYEEREEMARQKFITSEPNTITAYLNMENPVYITSDENGTLLDFNEEYDEEYDEYGEPEGLLVDFIEALSSNASEYAYNDVDFSFLYEYAYDNGGVYASDAVKIIKERIVDELSDENGDLAVNEVIRLAFEDIGFDGIIDTSVYYKFRNMSGMDSGTTHYIVFNSNQIKSADIATYDDNGNVIPLSQRFDTSKEDIRYSDRDYVAYDYTAILKESTIDTYLKDYASESSPNYAQAYIAYMSPRNFLELTTSGTLSKLHIENESRKFVKEEFEDYTRFQPIQLKIDHKTGKVSTHEGRHRMVALSMEDIYDVPVLLFDSSNTSSKKTLNNFKLIGQFNEYHSTIVGEAIPLSYANRDLIIEKFGTQSRDQKIRERFGIRKTLQYSDRDQTSVYDLMGEKDRIVKENEKRKEAVKKMSEMLKLEKKVTDGKVLNQKQIESVASQLLKLTNSAYSKEKLSSELREVYTYLNNSTDATWEELYSRFLSIADSILAEAKPETVVDDYAKMVLKDIRNTRISLSEDQKREAQSIFDKNWNRYFFGRVIITDSAIGIESKWQEWASLYPDIFDADISDGDMIGELYDIINNLQDASEAIVEYDAEERRRWLADEIYDKFAYVFPIVTTADKYSEKIKKLRFEYRNAIRDLRNDYKARIEEQKLADDIHYGKKMHEMYKKIRDQKNEEIALAKQYGRERLNKYKDNAERKTLIQSTLSTVMSLNRKLATNSKDVHIPEALKPVVINLINAIDFSSKTLLGMSGTKKDMRGLPTRADIATENALSKARSLETEKASLSTLKIAIQDALELFESAQKVLDGVSDGTVDSSVASLDAEMVDSIKLLIKHLNILEGKGVTNFVLQEMNIDHLKTLNAMVKSINHWAVVADKALANKHKKRISDLSMQTVSENDVLGERQEYIEGIESIKNFFNWSNLLPVNAFKRLGDAAMEFFDGLRDSQDKVTFNRQEVMDFTDKLFKGHKVKEWRKDVKTFEVILPTGKKKTVKMPVSYIMSLYCVSKQEDAKRHIYGQDINGNKITYTDEKGKVQDGGGITISGFKDGKFTLKVSKDLKNTIINEGVVKQITSVLTKEQIEVADALQQYMNTKGTEWGDAVSMALYGIKKFGVKDYFPITVSPHTINSDKTKENRGASLFSIINYGFTKERNPNANQSIEIGDIFDIFANHMNMLAIYNAYALSIYDIARWYNFKGKTEDGDEISVTQSIENAFGKGATSYVNNLIKDLNGQHESSRLGFISKIFKNTKVAMVGNSLSVALLQPTAYLKAMVKVSPKYLLKSALYVKDFGAKKGVEKAKKYCGIALLKSQGYFETGVSANTTTKMMHDESVKEKIIEWSLKGAEFMDERTWGVLWNACEFEVRAKRKDLKVGSNEFYDVVAEKLRDVIYETQVVDSPLTKSDLMRSPDGMAKSISMFASEMTVAYNMVLESAYDTMLDIKRNGKKGALKRNRKNIMITLTAYTLTSAASAILTTAVQAFRDDDDEEKTLDDYIKQYFANFLSDWLIIGKIPYFKEALSMAQGFDSSRTDTLWLQSAFKAVEYWGKAIEGKEGALMKAIDESSKSVSYVSGVAAYNQWRELRALLRKIGVMD